VPHVGGWLEAPNRIRACAGSAQRPAIETRLDVDLVKLLPKSLATRLLPDRTRFLEPLRTTRDRLAAWFDDQIIDHGFLRLLWKNRARVSERVIRSNQPNPFDMAWAKRQGIRTIVTARHDQRHGGFALTREFCEKHGLTFTSFPVLSRDPPSKEALLESAAFFRFLEYPALFHCKSGADRVGFLSALYLIVHENQPVEIAKKQLSLRFLHIRAAKTGILDFIFEQYLEQTRQTPMPFLEWVEAFYDQEQIAKRFKHSYWADILDRVILRHE
jgi:protein tyrosine/serine phosphatase